MERREMKWSQNSGYWDSKAERHWSDVTSQPDVSAESQSDRGPLSSSSSSSPSCAFAPSSSSPPPPSDRMPSLLLLSALFSAQFPCQLEPECVRRVRVNASQPGGCVCLCVLTTVRLLFSL